MLESVLGKSSVIPVCLSESCLSHDVTRALCYCPGKLIKIFSGECTSYATRITTSRMYLCILGFHVTLSKLN